MLTLPMPCGTYARVPETQTEDYPYFAPGGTSLAEARAYYEEQGYVVLRGAIPTELCETLRDLHETVLKPSRTPMLRQKNVRYERNRLDRDGFLANPIFNVQDLGSGALDPFRRAALDILTHPNIRAATQTLLGTERSKLIQSMLFEAPAGTWPHQDSYYQDSATAPGLCVGAWFALEDIDAGAGRFFVCPGSHRSFTLLRNGGDHNFATRHHAYQNAVLEQMRAQSVSYALPYLAAGDVLFWNSLTVHGSLAATRPHRSRLSLTAHYLRESDAMLQFHSRIRPQNTQVHDGMTVALLHDQNILVNRLMREAAFRFPAAYMAARTAAIRALLLVRSKMAEPIWTSRTAS